MKAEKEAVRGREGWGEGYAIAGHARNDELWEMGRENLLRCAQNDMLWGKLVGKGVGKWGRRTGYREDERQRGG